MKSPTRLLTDKWTGDEPAVLHPAERGLARHWVKRRLAMLFPELRADPAALAAAYDNLGLASRPVGPGGDARPTYELCCGPACRLY